MNKIIEFATWLLEAAKCKLEKENNDAIGARLEKIENRLKSIERNTTWQFLYIAGLSLVMLGVTVLVLPPEIPIPPSSSLFCVIIGVLLMLVSSLIKIVTK